jgi:hypothetical protein
MKGKALLCATLFLPSLVLAQEPEATSLEGTVDAYFMPAANIEFRQRDPLASGDESGDGYGVRALVHVTDMFMATGEYQTVSYDTGTGSTQDFDRDDFRVGGGIGLPSGTGLFAEYVSAELGDGFGAHARAAGTLGERIALHAQVGYVQVEDEERLGGFEFSVGGSYAIINVLQGTLGAFADYRVTNLEGAETQAELKVRDFRVGARYTFGGAAAMPEPAEESIGVEPVVEDGASEAPAEQAPAEQAPAGEAPVEDQPTE